VDLLTLIDISVHLNSYHISTVPKVRRVDSKFLRALVFCCIIVKRAIGAGL